MSDEKYVGAVAAAKNAALAKAALEKKLDKTGGTITGSLKVDGIISAGMSLDLKSGIDAGGCIHSEESLLAPSLGLYNGAKETSVSIDCSGDNAAKITSLSSDGKSHYARLAVGTPTGDNDAATKAYVDGHAAGYEVITVTSTNVSDVGYDASEGAHKFAVTFDASFDSILANLAANKPMKFNITIPDNTGGFPLSFTTGYVSALGNSMYEFTGTLAGAPVVLSIGGLGSASVYLYADYLPDPNPDGSDDGKALVVNKHKWEMKKVDAVTDVATESTNGLMSASDKAKLNGIATGATRTTVDRLLLDNSDNPVSNRVLKAALDAKAYKTVATAKADGLMSASDKSKLDGIESGANKTIVDAALDASSTNSVQNKAVKAALDKKADKTALDNKADTTVATASANGLMSAADKEKLDSMYDIVATSTDGETFDITPAQLHEKLKGVPTTCAIKVVDTIIPLHRVQLQSGGDTRYIFQITKDNGVWEPNTRLTYTASAGGTYAGTTWGKSEYDLLASTPGILKFTGAAKAQFSGSKDVTIDIPTGEGSVRYDETQKLTSDQKFRACQNIGAVNQKHAFIDGTVILQAVGHDDGASVVNITSSEKSNDYTLTLDGGPENVPVYVAGLETPTDAQTDYATNVAYVKAKIAEVAASGGVDVDNALSATSTNPVQNKVITSALAKKAGTAVATESANGLMSAADKKKLDGIADGANKTVVDAALDAGSANPVQNKAVKAALDNKADKTALDAKADKTALNAKLDKTGGTLTGNLTGKYITGTWLQSTAASDLGRTPGKIAVLDDSGWVYYRTPAELLADIGAMSGGDYYTKAETDAAIAVRASTSAYGTTKLSNSTTSSSKTLAATPYAVKTALAQAKAYVDSAIAVAINSAY